MTRRVIVIGGTGYFGSVAVHLLRAQGLTPLAASRRETADLAIDVHNGESLRNTLRRGDIVLDAVGPFQDRGRQLVEAAIDVGCDVVDLADSLQYVRQLDPLAERIAAAGIRVFTACSTVSAVSAAVISLSGIDEPVGITGFLVPATRHTAVRGTAESLFRSVGRPIKVFLDGQLVTQVGWQTRRAIQLPPPLGRRIGYRFETADAWTLPARWPSLRSVDWYVDTNVWGLNTAFRLAAWLPALRWLANRAKPAGRRLARLLGRGRSGVAYEIEDASGKSKLACLTAEQRGYVIPVAPAVLVVRALAEERFHECGLVPADRQIDPQQLIRYLEAQGVEFSLVATEH